MIKIWLPVILYVSVIMVMALRPVPLILRGKHVDKIVHVALYGTLSCLALRSFRRSNARHPAVLSFLLAVAVGIAEEGLQGLGSRRTADRYDLLADAAGAFGAVVAATIYHRARGGVRRKSGMQ